MANRSHMLGQLSAVFEERQAQVLTEVIYDSYNDLARREDFSELKDIVRDLAETQQRTGQRIEDLAEAQNRTEQRVEDLAEAQNRTEQRVEDLAEAQQRTEQRVEDLAEAQNRTENAVQHLAREVGGLSNRLGGFSGLLERAAGHLDGEIVPVVFCYRVHRKVQEKVQALGYRLVLSNGRMPN